MATMGTAKTAPINPWSAVPASVAKSTQSGCTPTEPPCILGTSRLPSICWATRKRAATSRAFKNPPPGMKSAMATAGTAPRKAPMTGMISVAATQAPTGRAYFPMVKNIIVAPRTPMIEHSAGDLLPLEQQVHGDKYHQEQVENGSEDPEHPTDDARRNVRHLFGRWRVLLQQLQDSILVQPGHVPADVGNVLEPIDLGDDPVDEILRVADHDLYLADRWDDDQEHRHTDDQNQDEEHPDHGQGPRHPQPLESPHEGVQGIGKDAGSQEGQQHAADLAHKGHQQHDPHRERDVL